MELKETVSLDQYQQLLYYIVMKTVRYSLAILMTIMDVLQIAATSASCIMKA